DKFEIKKGRSYIKLQAFAIHAMQHLYRLWKTRLHYYYKSPSCGATDEVRLTKPPSINPKTIATHGESKTQQEMLLTILKPRSSYFHAKGTALCSYARARAKNQGAIRHSREEKIAKQLEETQERTRQLEKQRDELQRATDAMKQE
ncbi:Rac guanine nucleotide exchange factor JJ, partial [Bienertia sinuspersici]